MGVRDFFAFACSPCQLTDRVVGVIGVLHAKDFATAHVLAVAVGVVAVCSAFPTSRLNRNKCSGSIGTNTGPRLDHFVTTFLKIR